MPSDLHDYISNAPTNEEIIVEMTFTARAFWASEEKRWLLVRPLNVNYVPHRAKWKLDD